jgi:hypothetical protein
MDAHAEHQIGGLLAATVIFRDWLAAEPAVQSDHAAPRTVDRDRRSRTRRGNLADGSS